MKTITLSGSMRFQREMMEIAYFLEAKEGNCVLSCVYAPEGESITEEDLRRLSQAHFRKIRLSDCLYVVNINGYIGQTTKEEIKYARALGKEILYHI
ncbi:MAG: hypothetical protein IJC48_07300 [Clostridia bacterium]|nr:hypothetical protein [Clostridia bacterium]